MGNKELNPIAKAHIFVHIPSISLSSNSGRGEYRVQEQNHMAILIIVIAALLLIRIPADTKDPIDRAIDKMDNHPEDLDIEDMFWLDEILGDD